MAEAAVAPYWRACATDPRSRAQVHATRPAAAAAADAAVDVPAGGGIRRRADGCLPHRCSHAGEGGHPLHAVGSAEGRAIAVVDDGDDYGCQTLGCSEQRC